MHSDYVNSGDLKNTGDLKSVTTINNSGDWLMKDLPENLFTPVRLLDWFGPLPVCTCIFLQIKVKIDSLEFLCRL